MSSVQDWSEEAIPADHFLQTKTHMLQACMLHVNDSKCCDYYQLLKTVQYIVKQM